MLTVSIVALLILLLGGFLMSFFIQADYARDEKNWQEKLSLIAETKADSLSQWITSERSNIQNIAENPSLQIYVTEWLRANQATQKVENNADELATTLPTAPAENKVLAEDSAEATFIRSLMVYSAEKLGYTEVSTATDTGDNLSDTTMNLNTGLMLTSTSNTPLIAVPSSALHEKVLESLEGNNVNNSNMSDIYYAANGDILIGYSHPVRAIQASSGDAPIARLIGIKEISKPLAEHLLTSEGVDSQIKIALVKTDSGNLQHLTVNDSKSNKIQIQDIMNDPATHLEAQSAAQIGAWLQGNAINKVPTLITSYAVKNTPWIVLVSVPREHALAASDMRRQSMWTMMVAFSVIMALLIVAIWFIANSQRALSTSHHFRNLAKHSSMQEALLKLIANAQPESLFLIDSNFRFRYANYHAVKTTGTNIENLMGKTLSDALGQAKAQTLITLATEAMNSGRTQTLMLSLQKDGNDQTILRTLVPVPSLGMAAETPREDPHVLIIDRDITEVTEARERRMKLNHELIELLVALMDQRDQHANNHSRYVAELAQAIAANMGLKENVQQYVYNAGLLMNVGKMIVPEKWLNSSEPLDDKNIKSIRQSLKASSQLLSRLDFDANVITALKQAHEYVDGTGIEGLKGNEISIEARIITVANDCVSMLSRRAYRNPLSWEDAAKSLTNDVDTKYDRGVVAALISYMENMGGKEKLKVISSKKAA
jgi:PAS domain S-box-containing protein